MLYDVTGPDGRLLYATDTGPLPDATVAAVADAAFDLVLMEETFGDVADHGTDHLDLDDVRRPAASGSATSAPSTTARTSWPSTCPTTTHRPPS